MYNEHQKPYHIGFVNEVEARYAILPGDPGRVEKIAAHLANPRFVARNREYTTWVGELEDEPVLVMSTGMGGPSAAIGIELGHTYHAGVVQCKDSFYGQHSPERMPVGYELMNKWDAWIKAGCLASEMESAAVFIVSQILGMRAGCVLNVLWNQERRKQGLSDTESQDMTAAIQVSIEAIRTLIFADKEN